MSRRNVVTFYTAPARSGKTFRLVVRICDEVLPLTEGMIYTNLPLHVDLIAEYCADRHKMSAEEVASRIHVIPREVEAGWRDAGMPIYNSSGQKTGTNPFDGPWEYFADKRLAGSTVIIDEIHNFCGSIGTSKAISNNWQKWLGELGHNQAVFICISQAPEKVHTCIKQEAQASYTIRNTGLDRDPYFRIEVYDWLELWSGLFGMEYKIFVFEQETQKTEGRRQKGQRKMHLMGQPYFSFYDSFNKPIASEQTDNLNPFEHEFEKHLRKGPVRGRLSLLRWFFFKNMQPLLSRGGMAVAFACVLFWLLCGGAGDVTQYISRSMAGAFARKSDKQEETGDAEITDEAAQRLDKYASLPQPKDDQDRLELIRKTYEDELRKALIEQETLSQELKKAKEEIARNSAVVLITPNSIVLKRGQEYGIGDKISTGDYQGRTLVGINYRQRAAYLDNGAVLRLSD